MQKRTIGVIVALFLGCAAAGVAATGWMLHKVNADDSSAYRIAWGTPHVPAGSALPVLWDAPTFSYTDENGRPFTSQDLAGHVWISDFFFSSCTNICPLMTLKMSELQKKITVPSVQFVSFSVDPDYDTPKVLKEYAKGWKADETRWHFLSTDRAQLAQTAAGMKVFVSAPQKNRPIQHSSLFTLVDAHGKVRGVYDSNDESALNNLVADAMTLAGAPTKSASAVAWSDPASDVKSNSPGANLYVACGCVACHSQGHVAPPLIGLFGSKVLLADGKTVIADENYLRKQLLAPDTVRIAGYAPLMPNYHVQLDDGQVDQVIQYIESLAAKPVVPAGK